jgi:hypothetical protein
MVGIEGPARLWAGNSTSLETRTQRSLRASIEVSFSYDLAPTLPNARRID